VRYNKVDEACRIEQKSHKLYSLLKENMKLLARHGGAWLLYHPLQRQLLEDHKFQRSPGKR
jgi:hypothetical protein